MRKASTAVNSCPHSPQLETAHTATKTKHKQKFKKKKRNNSLKKTHQLIMEVYNSDQTPSLSFLSMWESGDIEKNFSCLSSHQLRELCQRKPETDISLSVGDKFYSRLWQQRTKWGSFDIPDLIVLHMLRKSQLVKIYFQNSNLTETKEKKTRNKCKLLWGVTCTYHPVSLRYNCST